ncbi:MAG TPA: hypothetical protein VFA26_04455, partial [Gemmataceae bacterium]|nr:hypothetical protein [Gemmataceae bacterium]
EVRLPPPEEPKRGEEPPASPPPARPVRRPRLPPRSGPLWQRPLVWGNRAFDRATEGLGPPGVWLRRPAGRTALGWAGLVFLAAAAALVLLARIGWTW